MTTQANSHKRYINPLPKSICFSGGKVEFVTGCPHRCGAFLAAYKMSEHAPIPPRFHSACYPTPRTKLPVCPTLRWLSKLYQLCCAFLFDGFPSWHDLWQSWQRSMNGLSSSVSTISIISQTLPAFMHLITERYPDRALFHLPLTVLLKQTSSLELDVRSSYGCKGSNTQNNALESHGWRGLSGGCPLHSITTAKSTRAARRCRSRQSRKAASLLVHAQ
jgi:hypothetical protein